MAALEQANAVNEPRQQLFYEKAYRLLDSKEVGLALDVSRESVAVRERYGFGAAPVASRCRRWWRQRLARRMAYSAYRCVAKIYFWLGV